MKIMDKSKRAYALTMRKMVPSIFIAMVATGLGFLSLYISPVPMIQDFGSMLTIGIIVSFIVALLVLLPLLYVRDSIFNKEKPVSKKTVKKDSKKGIVYRMTKGLIKFRYVILIFALATAGLGLVLDQEVGVETDIETFMPQDNQALDDIHQLRGIVGSTEQLSIVYKGDVLSEEILAWSDQMQATLPTMFENEIVEIRSINQILNQTPQDDSLSTLQQIEQIPYAQRKLIINDDYTVATMTVMIRSLEASELERFVESLNRTINSMAPSSLDVTVTGQAVIDVEMMQGLTTGRYTITLLGMFAVFMGLLIIYRNPLKALTPLIPITLIVGWSGLFMYLLGIDYTPLTATLGALIIGIGTEFTILIMERFEQERAHQNSDSEAISVALSKLSKPILASALTTIGGFSALIISDFQILSNFGIMTVVNLTLALISTIFVMPAILIIQSKVFTKKAFKVQPSEA